MYLIITNIFFLLSFLNMNNSCPYKIVSFYFKPVFSFLFNAIVLRFIIKNTKFINKFDYYTSLLSKTLKFQN